MVFRCISVGYKCGSSWLVLLLFRLISRFRGRLCHCLGLSSNLVLGSRLSCLMGWMIFILRIVMRIISRNCHLHLLCAKSEANSRTLFPLAISNTLSCCKIGPFCYRETSFARNGYELLNFWLATFR